MVVVVISGREKAWLFGWAEPRQQALRTLNTHAHQQRDDTENTPIMTYILSLTRTPTHTHLSVVVEVPQV